MLRGSYVPTELRQLPVNTVLSGLCAETQKDVVNEQKDETTAAAADVAVENDNRDEDGAVAAEDDKNMEVSFSCFVHFVRTLGNHLNVGLRAAYLSVRWRRGRVSDLRPEVVGSSLGRALRRKNSGPVSHTYVPLSPSSITWYRRKLGSKQTRCMIH